MTSTTNDIYILKDVPLYEALYGSKLISLGGLAAIDNMFSDINLTNLKLLDIGFGLGGVAFYLAQKYHLDVSGVEVHPWMVEYALQHSPKAIAHLLKFAVYNAAGEIPFDAGSFDLVYSKGVLNHVHDKLPLFLQINKVIKTSGLFVIADWIYPEYKKDSEPLAKESLTTYRNVLEEAGFININFRDDSSIFLEYVQTFLENISKRKEFIIKEFGEEMLVEILKNHQELLEEIETGRKMAVRIKASKR